MPRFEGDIFDYSEGSGFLTDREMEDIYHNPSQGITLEGVFDMIGTFVHSFGIDVFMPEDSYDPVTGTRKTSPHMLEGGTRPVGQGGIHDYLTTESPREKYERELKEWKQEAQQARKDYINKVTPPFNRVGRPKKVVAGGKERWSSIAIGSGSGPKANSEGGVAFYDFNRKKWYWLSKSVMDHMDRAVIIDSGTEISEGAAVLDWEKIMNDAKPGASKTQVLQEITTEQMQGVFDDIDSGALVSHYNNDIVPSTPNKLTDGAPGGGMHGDVQTSDLPSGAVRMGQAYITKDQKRDLDLLNKYIPGSSDINYLDKPGMVSNGNLEAWVDPSTSKVEFYSGGQQIGSDEFETFAISEGKRIAEEESLARLNESVARDAERNEANRLKHENEFKLLEAEKLESERLAEELVHERAVEVDRERIEGIIDNSFDAWMADRVRRKQSTSEEDVDKFISDKYESGGIGGESIYLFPDEEGNKGVMNFDDPAFGRLVGALITGLEQKWRSKPLAQFAPQDAIASDPEIHEGGGVNKAIKIPDLPPKHIPVHDPDSILIAPTLPDERDAIGPPTEEGELPVVTVPPSEVIKEDGDPEKPKVNIGIDGDLPKTDDRRPRDEEREDRKLNTVPMFPRAPIDPIDPEEIDINPDLDPIEDPDKFDKNIVDIPADTPQMGDLGGGGGPPMGATWGAPGELIDYRNYLSKSVRSYSHSGKGKGYKKRVNEETLLT